MFPHRQQSGAVPRRERDIAPIGAGAFPGVDIGVGSGEAERRAPEGRHRFDAGAHRRFSQVDERVGGAVDDSGIADVVAERRGRRSPRPDRARHVEGCTSSALRLELAGNDQTRQAGCLRLLGQRGWREESASERQPGGPGPAPHESRQPRAHERPELVMHVDAAADRQGQPAREVDIVLEKQSGNVVDVDELRRLSRIECRALECGAADPRLSGR